MDLPELQRIPEVVRNALGGVLSTTAAEQMIGVVRDAAQSLHRLTDVAGRVAQLEEDAQEQDRELTDLRAHLADVAARLGRLEQQTATQARELSELRVRIHGATARVARLEEETGHHTRELNDLRVRVEHVADRVPHVNLGDLQDHLAENERLITAALAEIRHHIAAAGIPGSRERSGD
jgi:septal ring factor EnvC (AmiA/AmiB activator)